MQWLISRFTSLINGTEAPDVSAVLSGRRWLRLDNHRTNIRVVRRLQRATAMMEITAFVVAQREKALLVGDYWSYRKQLSRRILTVRRKLNYVSTKGPPKNSITPQDIASNHEYVKQSSIT